MDYIKGFTFRLEQSKTDSFAGEETKEALRQLKKSTTIDTVTIAFIALQETPHTETIEYHGEFMPSDDELKAIIAYAKSLGLRIILKPMVNCKNGVWRAFINFFDLEAPCEPKWSKWFRNYTEYIVHYAKLAQESGCDIYCIGCELVMSERKSDYWRALIKQVRKVFYGLITYNTDKYQESGVTWWDAVDIISSSGYYPINQWEENLTRIHNVVEQYQKPFFFAECGIPCRTGSASVPNDWTFEGPLDLEEQNRYYQTMFEVCNKHDWISGFVCWDWVSTYQQQPVINDGYSVFGKPACETIRRFYSSK